MDNTDDQTPYVLERILPELIAIDDGGIFSFHRSKQDLPAMFEYVGEAACILDRGGSAYRLALDSNGQLILVPSPGLVDFQWLR